MHALASTTAILSTPNAKPETLAHTLINHTSTSQTLTNQLAHISTLQSYLERQHAALRTQLATLQTTPALSTPPTLPRQTTEHIRSTKHLRAKIREAEDKVSLLQTQTQGRGRSTSTASIRGASASSASAIEDMLEQQRGLDELRERVERLERQVEEFAGLPAERESARKEVGKLEVELDGLRRRRDGLFEGMVGR